MIVCRHVVIVAEKRSLAIKISPKSQADFYNKYLYFDTSMYHTRNMTKLSKVMPEPRYLSIFIDNFWNAITLLEDKQETEDFLRILLTHTEVKMLAKRIQIAKMLLEGYSYDEIKEYVKVTSGTIAQINNALQTQGRGLQIIVDRLIKIEKEQRRKLEQQTQRIIPPGPYRLMPDLVEVGIEAVKRSAKKSYKKKSVTIRPFDKMV